MKKVIKGKVYDTETAKLIGEYEPNPYKTDFRWYYEELYQKKTGEFFLHGKGNAASKYAEACSYGGHDPGEKILPITYEEAQDWAEEVLDADDYITLFGDPESDEKQQLHIRISQTAYARAKQNAAKQGITLAAYIESLIK